MEIALIILCSAVISAFILSAYKLGFDAGYKKKTEEKDKVEINDGNLSYVRDLIKIANYTGKEFPLEDLNE